MVHFQMNISNNIRKRNALHLHVLWSNEGTPGSFLTILGACIPQSGVPHFYWFVMPFFFLFQLSDSGLEVYLFN